MKLVIVILFILSFSSTVAQTIDDSIFQLEILEWGGGSNSENSIKMINDKLYLNQSSWQPEYYLNDSLVISLNNVQKIQNDILKLFEIKSDTVAYKYEPGDHSVPEYDIKFSYKDYRTEFHFWGGKGIINPIQQVMNYLNKLLPEKYLLRYPIFIKEIDKTDYH